MVSPLKETKDTPDKGKSGHHPDYMSSLTYIGTSCGVSSLKDSRVEGIWKFMMLTNQKPPLHVPIITKTYVENDHRNRAPDEEERKTQDLKILPWND